MEIVLYTIDCPNCLRLENKLKQNRIPYAVCKDEVLMKSLGFDKMPVLQICDKSFLNFKEAMKWIDEQKMGD